MNIHKDASICPHCQSKQPSNSKNIFYLILIIIILAAFGRACSTTTPPAPPEPQASLLDIARALKANNITGCGDLEYYLNPGQTSEYTVKCSRDGKTYTTYTVWPKIEKVMLGTPP